MLKDGPVRALGAMSGTSLDGIDAAVIVTDGHDVLEVGDSDYRPYTETEREVHDFRGGEPVVSGPRHPGGHHRGVVGSGGDNS